MDKYCIDCDHFYTLPLAGIHSSDSVDVAICSIPNEVITYDLIWGKKVSTPTRYCENERLTSCSPKKDKCGKEGKYFKQKNSKQGELAFK